MLQMVVFVPFGLQTEQRRTEKKELWSTYHNILYNTAGFQYKPGQ